MRLTPLLLAASLSTSAVYAQQTPPLSPLDGSPSKTTIETAAPAIAPQPPAIPVVSLEWIRGELAKPAPMLTRPEPAADFTVFIEVRRPLQALFDTPPWATGGATYSKTCPPRQSSYLPADDCSSGGGGGVSVDIVALVRQAKRAHDAHVAHEEVQREIEAYCAVQPESGKEIAICPGWSALR